jgi:hypothetical protein
MGLTPGGAAAPNGTDFWWDSFAGNTGNCWWGNTAASGRSVTTSPPLLPDCANGTDPSLSIGTSYAPNEMELVNCFAGFTVGPYPNGDPTLCDWTKTPPKPGSSSTPLAATAGGSSIASARRAEFTALCDAMPQSRTCSPFTGRSAAQIAAPAPKPVSFNGAWARRALGLYTCADWKRADSGLRTKLLARLRQFTGGAVEGDALTGYGSVLTSARATRLFNGRCAPRYANAFALYKLYGSAAAFAGVAP